MLFEHLAATDESHRVAGRKAVALARARAEKRYARFIEASTSVSDRDDRLALVAGELEELVKQACADCDYQAHENVLATVQEHLGYIVEARRPKMCPYHKEVMDISLASGEPQAGFGAMAQHAWGQQHCQGAWEGGCNFKPEMTTQTYWDQKAERAEQRRQEREQQRQLEIQQQPVMPQNEVEENFEQPVEEFGADETSAVGIGAEPAVAEPQMAFAKQAEALKTVDVEQGGKGPSPKMDKRTWTPENVSFLDDTEGEGSPHPTIHQDIAQPALYKGDGWGKEDGRFEQTDAVLEKQDVDKRSNPTDGGGPSTSVFPKGDQAKPVTSAMTPEQQAEMESIQGLNRQNAPQQPTAQYVDGQAHPSMPGVQWSNQINGWVRHVDPQFHGAAVDPDRNPIAELISEEEAHRAILAWRGDQPNPYTGEEPGEQNVGLPQLRQVDYSDQGEEQVRQHIQQLMAQGVPEEEAMRQAQMHHLGPLGS